jgi:hypothetical protein
MSFYLISQTRGKEGAFSTVTVGRAAQELSHSPLRN